MLNIWSHGKHTDSNDLIPQTTHNGTRPLKDVNDGRTTTAMDEIDVHPRLQAHTRA